MNNSLLRRIAALAVISSCAGGCVISSTTGVADHPDGADNWIDVETDSGAEGPLAVGVTPTSPEDHLLTQSHVTVLEPEARPVAVQFESEQAQATFAQQVGLRYEGGDAVKRQSSGGIPLLYNQEEISVLSKNAYFNEQVALADEDRDGQISNGEARAYSQRLGAPLTE
jgi:hypothetical protein